MVFKSYVCIYKQPWKCYWLIGLFACINFWLISRLNLPHSNQETTNNENSELTSNNAITNSTDQMVDSEMQSSTEVQTKTTVLDKNNEHTEDVFKNEIIDVNLGRFDSSRKYKMFDNVIIGTNYVNLSLEYDVTLATQSSLDKLHWISHIVRFIFLLIIKSMKI